MRIHFIGVGGVGMAALAVLLKSRGHDVSGCDLGNAKRLEWLAANGVRVTRGHDPAHVADADMVIVTPAVSAANPERAAVAPDKLRFRGEALAELVGGCDSVAVCGSHGKTTTATFVAKLLIALGERVSWAIGGETGAFPVAGTAGDPSRPEVLVVEADESDGTLALYRAATLVVTNCEYDHPDHFPTPEAYAACFDAARKNAREVIEGPPKGDAPAAFESALAPLAPHNRANARLAAQVAMRRGHSVGAIARVLAEVVAELPDRRFQRLWPVAGADSAAASVYTDYAHHPTEIACAVAMARAKCAGKLRVLFQPHRYSRTKALAGAFPAAFAQADEVVICPTYAAFERPVEGGDSCDLYAACRAAWTDSSASPVLRLARSCEEAWWHARLSARSGDVTLLLGAGDIIALAPLVVASMGDAASRPPERKIWLGAGSNTWRSALATGEVYVRTSHPAGRPGAELLAGDGIGCAIPWMAGIPGTVGGWIRMNAGAFGHSISEAVEAVKVDGRWLAAADCAFGYRTSAIRGEIQDVRWKSLPPACESAADFLARRRAFPPGTKGSVFRNPEGDFAGRLLDAAGCRGLRIGGAHVWEEHANVIVCDPGSPPDDFLALAQLMRGRVERRFGVRLVPEVRGLELVDG